MVLDPNGKERYRLEGYLPRDEFRAQLELALGRVAFMHKRWEDAERWYGDVADRRSNTAAAPEAIYWRGVAYYQRTKDHSVLHKVAEELKEKYPGTTWQLRSAPWGE